MSGGLVGKWTALNRGSIFPRQCIVKKKKCPSLNFIPYSRTISLVDNPPDVVSATL